MAHQVINLGDAFTATDADGDALEYQLEGADTAKFTLDRSTGGFRARAGERYDFETQPTYRVTVKADDGNGGTATVDVTINI